MLMISTFMIAAFDRCGTFEYSVPLNQPVARYIVEVTGSRQIDDKPIDLITQSDGSPWVILKKQQEGGSSLFAST